MGLQFVEKGAVILSPRNFELLKKAHSSSETAVAEIQNANGASKESPFRDAFYADCEKQISQTEHFLDVLLKNIQKI